MISCLKLLPFEIYDHIKLVVGFRTVGKMPGEGRDAEKR